MSLAILTGVADRFAALVLAVYCLMTAVLWKQFWKAGDLRLQGRSRGRETFWDFLKNLAVAGRLLNAHLWNNSGGRAAVPARPLLVDTSLSGAWHGEWFMTATAPVIRYWYLYTDSEGISRLRQCAMTEFELKSIQAPAAPAMAGAPGLAGT